MLSKAAGGPPDSPTVIGSGVAWRGEIAVSETPYGKLIDSEFQPELYSMVACKRGLPATCTFSTSDGLE
jgi:hypothetical protein